MYSQTPISGPAPGPAPGKPPMSSLTKALIVLLGVAVIALLAIGGLALHNHGKTPAASPLAATAPASPAPAPVKKIVRHTTKNYYGGSGPGAAAPAQDPAAGGGNCGGGVTAGPNTSCPFALNVSSAWNSADNAGVPSGTADVTAYSPVTGQNYIMSCSWADYEATCTGGNNASVTIQY